jgi:hypothetical protein
MPRKRVKREVRSRPRLKDWRVVPVGYELGEHGDLRARLVRIATARTMEVDGRGQSSVSEVARDLLLPALTVEEARLGLPKEGEDE